MNRKLKKHAEQELRQRQELLALFDTEQGERVLQYLERRFETDLPVFQGRAGTYDALDAMRRDAHREVFLVIRRLMELTRNEDSQPNNPNHNDDTE
ncbi:MAG: hypothetical protein IJE66_07765 [Akkermansia sp.]|nr:hypothetical protein [Akkermansia sp.]